MKKLITIALLCAMLLTTLASCGMKAGNVDVDAYAAEGGAADAAFKTELDATADVWDGSSVASELTDTDNDGVYEIYTGAEMRYFVNLIGQIESGVGMVGESYILMADLDLTAAMWGTPASTKYFGGTFDGNGHVVKYKAEVTSSGYRSFLGSIGGSATVKNLSLIGTYTNNLTAAKNHVGSLVTRVMTVAGETVTIDNCYTDVDFITNSTYKMGYAGALATYIDGDGDLVIKNCENAGDIAVNDAGAAGIIGEVVAAANITIENCAVTGSISSGSTRTGGIIGRTKAISGKLTIKGCTVSADISGTTQVAGIVGYLAETKGGDYEISDCTVSGNITATTMSGGVIGYIAKAVDSLVISGCNVTGSFTGGRTTGGIAGTINMTNAVTIENCFVTADLTFNLTDTKNNAVGGLVGKLQNEATITGCTVAATINVTHTPSGDGGTSDVVSGAAGLVGRVFCENSTGFNVSFDECSVAGTYTFTDTDTDAYTLNAGAFVGSVGCKAEMVEPTVTFGAMLTAAKLVISGDVVVNEVNPKIVVVGYQTRDNQNGTYDLRFVFAAQDVYEGYGVNADIAYLDGTVTEKSVTSYATTVYKAVKDESGTTYAAADYGYDYLYTVVVKNVPEAINQGNKNLYVALEAFGENVGSAPVAVGTVVFGTALN